MGCGIVKLSEVVIDAAEVNGVFYQILMLECRVKEVFDDFEIFFLVVVVAIAEINNAEEIHNIGQVIYRQAFGRIVF